jgi:hypothetical protein
MHRTDIEGFGHHEDRVEMEHYAGTATALPAYASSPIDAPLTTSSCYTSATSSYI